MSSVERQVTRLMTHRPWPWPEDTSREDKAKRIARSYRALVQRIAQSRCDDPAGDLYRLDQEFLELGVNWHMPVVISADPDEWMPAADIAHYISRTPKDIYNWARRGHIEQRTSADGTPEYSWQSVLDYAKRRRSRTHDRQSNDNPRCS